MAFRVVRIKHCAGSWTSRIQDTTQQQDRARTRPRCARRSGLVSQPGPGPLRAFYQRVKARRGFQKAGVATARKMTVLAWHLFTKDQDYAFA